MNKITLKPKTEVKIQSELINKKIDRLQSGYKLLRRIRKIENEILSNDAYNTKNMESQFKRLKDACADDETLELVALAYDFKKKLQKISRRNLPI